MWYIRVVMSARLPKRELKAKRPVASTGQPLQEMPGVDAILSRARLPYLANPLSEDDALNLICDARLTEPTFPISRLASKFSREVGC